MVNLIDIQLQIEKLQRQATDIRAKEFDKTIKDILAQMQAYDITIKDLQQATSKKRSLEGAALVKHAGKKKSPKMSKAKAVVAVKYRGPKGEAWSGRGSMPRWMSALVAKGRKKEEFAVKA